MSRLACSHRLVAHNPQAAQLTKERLLAGIHVIRAKDHAEVVAAVHMLPELLDSLPQVTSNPRLPFEPFCLLAQRTRRCDVHAADAARAAGAGRHCTDWRDTSGRMAFMPRGAFTRVPLKL